MVEFGSKEDRDYYVAEDKAHRGFVKWATEKRFIEEARVLDYEVGAF